MYVRTPSSSLLWGREVRLEASPFGVRQIGGVFAASDGAERRSPAHTLGIIQTVSRRRVPGNWPSAVRSSCKSVQLAYRRMMYRGATASVQGGHVMIRILRGRFFVGSAKAPDFGLPGALTGPVHSVARGRRNSYAGSGSRSSVGVRAKRLFGGGGPHRDLREPLLRVLGRRIGGDRMVPTSNRIS
jgi:hypothetical protein